MGIGARVREKARMASTVEEVRGCGESEEKWVGEGAREGKVEEAVSARTAR